ncbi:MAG: hypothetical protein HPZ77_07070 [Acidaminococcaceae bacterium]|nr:hypothetical protein [Acidaminococcaceae bacterium]
MCLKAGATVRFVWQLLLCFTKISKNKIPSSQAKGGLTYDEIGREIDDSSAFSITYMLAEVKIIILMKIQVGLEKLMIILKYVLYCSLKAEKWEALKAG